MITTGTEIVHDDLSVVRFVVRPTSRHISARWKSGRIICNVPPSISHEDARKALDSMSAQLKNNKPQLRYHEGDLLEFDGWNARITRQTFPGDRIFAFPSKRMTVIEVPQNFDFSAPDATKRISSVLCMVAQSLAPSLLIPRARELADSIQRHPLLWKISHGHRTLGSCSSKGEISLSYVIAFLPKHLRDYIIYHELAHLSEMNHSKRFHELCDQYCQGHERQYINELKHFSWPILK